MRNNNSRGRSRNGGGGNGEGRGGSRSRGGRGGGGGNRRGGGGGRNFRGNGGRSRGGRGASNRDPRAASQSGNQRERIAVESGALVLIDQFMLANPQFHAQLLDLIDDGPEAKDNVIARYGGTVIDLTPGTYRIERDPYAFTIVVHQDGSEARSDELVELADKEIGHVYVDTRCLAMIDRELLDDTALLEKYQQLWFSGQEKACRDLLRDNGGAVRYGFQRYGDELGVYRVPNDDVVCLWPDVVGETAQAAGAEAEEIVA